MANTLSTLLKNKARYWAGEVTKLAKGFAPNHLQSKITSRVDEKGEGSFVIRTTVNAPDARAQEYGSGLHARRGPKAKYPIYPKTKHALAFHWEVLDTNGAAAFQNSPKFLGVLPDGRGMFRFVEHPGIRPVNGGKGYIRPAQIEIRKRIKSELNKEIPNAIRAELKIGFTKR